ncbi:MAG: MFS transporter [Ornithinimicrobium sp.]
MLERLLPARLGRDFRWLFASSTSSNLGDGVLLTAGPLLVASVTRDPFAISMAVFAQRLPWLLFGLLAGGVVDRVDRRRLVMIADGVRAVVLVGVLALLLADQVSLVLLYLAFFLLGTAETFVDNAASTLTVAVVPRADLGVANSRIFGTAMITNQMAGPPLGAALFTVASGLAFGVHAVLLLLGVVLISRMRLPRRVRVEEVVPLRRQIREGMTWLWRYPPVRTLALMITIFNVTYGAVVGLYVLYAQERLEVGDVGFGILMSTIAVGAVLGSALYARLSARFSFAVLLRAGLIIETVSHAALALTHSALVAGVILFLFGVHAAIWGTTSTTVRQLAVPEQMLGRVNSVYMLGSLGGIAVGTLIGGWLAQSFGLLSAFWFAFGGSLVALIFLWMPMAYVAHAAEEPAAAPS